MLPSIFGKLGWFMFLFCLTLLSMQVRYHPACPKWLKPEPEGECFPFYVNLLLGLTMLVGLILCYFAK